MRNKALSFKRSLARHHERVKQLPKHPYALPVTIFLVAFILGIVGFVLAGSKTVGPSDVHAVRLFIDGKTQVLPTNAPTVSEFMKRLEVQIRPGDVVEPDADTAILDDNFHVNIYRAKPVTLIDGEHKTVAFSAEFEPRSVAKQVGVTIYPEDEIKTAQVENVLKEGVIGRKVVIDRATPANLNLYGTAAQVRTRAKTVKALLDEKKVKLAEGDTVQPAADTPLTPDTQVFVTRFGRQIVSTEEPIPMPLEVIEDASLSSGTQAVRQKGAPGKKLVTFEVELRNGREVSRRRIQEAIVLPPVKQVIAKGPAGSFGEALTRLRGCEAGYNYANKKNPVYRGAYQFNFSTWANYGGYYDPADAPPIVQDQKATETYQRRGWQPWPACSQKLGLQDIYR